VCVGEGVVKNLSASKYRKLKFGFAKKLMPTDENIPLYDKNTPSFAER